MFLTGTIKDKISQVIENSTKNITNFDELNKFTLKKIEYAIVPSLTFLFNKCFERGTFPKCFKKQ